MQFIKKFIKIIGIIAIVFIGILLLVQFAGAPIVKNYINNHSNELIGRKLTVGNLKINPFTGGVTLNDVECKEADGDSTFLHFDQLYARCHYLKLLHQEVVLPHIHLDSLNAQILYEDKRFNFTDIIEHFAKDSVEKDTMPSKWSIELDDIQIRQSNISYNVDTRLENINLIIPGLYFGNQQSAAGLAFSLPDDGGNVILNGSYNMAQSGYQVNIQLDSVNTDIFLPFIQEKLGESCIGALIGGNINVNGNLNDIININLDGNISLNELHYSNGPEDRLISAEQLDIDLIKGNLKQMLFTMNADLYNIDYLDETMYSPFKYHIDKLHLTANDLNINGSSNIKARAKLENNGSLSVQWNGPLTLEKGSSRATIALKNMQVKAFSPYCENYLAYPINGGNVSFNSETSLQNGNLDSHNKIDIYQLAIGQKNKKIKTDLNIPLKLGVSILEDVNKKISLEIPVKGNIKEPKFSFGKIIFKAVGNLILDAVAAPIVAMAKASNKNIDMDNLQVDILASEITVEQYATLDQIAELLKTHEDMRLIMTQRFNLTKAQNRYKTKGVTSDIFEDAEKRNQIITFYLTRHHGINPDRIEINTADKKTLKKYVGKDQYSIKVELISDPTEISTEETTVIDSTFSDSITTIISESFQ